VKKIAYIEIDTHAEIAQSFIEIMEDSPSFSVDYYFSKKIRGQVADHGETIILSDSSMIQDQLKDKRYDLIIIGTVHRYFNTFQAIVAQYHTAVIVHNMNFTGASKMELIKSIFKKDRIYRLKLLWKEDLLRSREVYREAGHLLVLDEELSSEVLRFLPLFYTKPVNKPENKVLTIVIPGGVSQKRRDYIKVISTIKTIENLIRNSVIDHKSIEFVFLGRAKNEELKNIVDLERSLQYVNITYFSERVSPSAFDDWMQKADVLWCPIQQETEFFSQQEVYGKTKMTGNLGDAIKFGKWAIFPANYQSKLDFIVQEQKDIISQFESLKNTSIDFHKDYSKHVVQRKLEKLLNELIVV